MSRFADLREEVWLANMEIPARGLAIYTWGNVSGFMPEAGVFAIKPSGVPYAELKPEHMVVVDLDNKLVEGSLRPSSDTRTHCVLYREFPGIGGIVHTHSPYACAWAQAHMAIPIYGTTHADHLACDIPCTPDLDDAQIEGNYEEETGNLIVRTFREGRLNPLEVPMVLVASHGPFAWAETPAKGVYNAAVLEEVAKMALFTHQLDPEASPLKESLRKKHYERKHGKNAYYGQ